MELADAKIEKKEKEFQLTDKFSSREALIKTRISSFN